MKLIPIDKDNLPKNAVLAYNGIDTPQIGVLLRDDEITVLCATDKGEMTNVTHYPSLTDIKPEIEKERRYLVSSTYMAKKDGGAGYYNSNNEITQAAGKSLIETLSSYFDYIQNEACTKLEVSIDSIIQLSFNCIEI